LFPPRRRPAATAPTACPRVLACRPSLIGVPSYALIAGGLFVETGGRVIGMAFTRLSSLYDKVRMAARGERMDYALEPKPVGTGAHASVCRARHKPSGVLVEEVAVARVPAVISTPCPGVYDVAYEGDLFRRRHVILSDVSDVAGHKSPFRCCFSILCLRQNAASVTCIRRRMPVPVRLLAGVLQITAVLAQIPPRSSNGPRHAD
jgi:hypothetical protein